MPYSPEGKFIVTDELAKTLADLDEVLENVVKEDSKIWPPQRNSANYPLAGNAHLAEAAKVGSGKAIFRPHRSGARNY